MLGAVPRPPTHPLLLALSSVLVTMVACASGPPTRPGARVDQHFQRALASSPTDLRRLFDGTDSAKGAELKDRLPQLASEGFARLSDEEMGARVALLSKVLDRAPDPLCAAITRRPTGPSVPLGLESLEDPELDAWCRVALRTVEAALRHERPRPLTDADRQQVARSLLVGLPDEQRGWVASIMRDAAQSTDGEVCWAGRQLYASAAQLDGDARFRAGLLLLGQ